MKNSHIIVKFVKTIKIFTILGLSKTFFLFLRTFDKVQGLSRIYQFQDENTSFGSASFKYFLKDGKSESNKLFQNHNLMLNDWFKSNGD